MVGINEASKLSANLLGWTEEERMYNTKLAEGKYEKNSNFIWYRKDDGQIAKVSTKYLDSYNTIKEPVLAVLDRIIDGELKGEQLDDYILNAATSGFLTLGTPFYSESISTKAISNVLEAIRSPEGRTSDGKLLLPPSMPTDDKILAIADLMYKSVEPGTFTSLGKLIDYVDDYTGEEQEKLGPVNKQAFITNITGLRLTNHNPDTQLKFAVSDYNKKTRNNIKPFLKIGEDSSISMLETYIAHQSKNYEYQQELFEKINAYSAIYGRYETYNILKDSGLSKPAVLSLIEGEFKPSKPPVLDDRALEVIKNSMLEDDNIYEEMRKTKQEFKSIFESLQNLTLYNEGSLNPFDLKEETFDRLDKNIGGEVSTTIPNAPTEPDERVNKLTGLPYNETAGTAYMDFDDPVRPLSMSKGGKVLKVLKRKCA